MNKEIIFDTIKDAVEYVLGVRVSCGYAWLVCDNGTGEWVVYERKYGAKKTREVYRGSNEAEAVACLMA